MFLIRSLPFAVLILSSLLTISRGEGESKEVSSKENTSKAQETFAKRLGHGDFPDQIAIESNHEPVEHRGEGGHGRPIPVPVPMKGFSGSIVLPMPPGYGGPGGPQPIGIRVPGPHKGPHGQFSAPHPHFVPPNSAENLKFQKSKEIYSGPPLHKPGQSHTQLHQQNHMTHQQIHEQVKQHVQHQILHSASAEAGIHPNHKPSGGLNVQPGPSHPKIMVPPGQGQYPTRGDQGPPKPGQPHGYQGQDAQLANSIFRELFDRQQQKQKHQGQGPTRGQEYAGGPQQQNFIPHGGNNRPQVSGSGALSGHKTVSHDLHAAGGQSPAVQYGGQPGSSAPGAWPEGPDSDMPKIVSLEVKCEKSVMRVYIAFDKPFMGVIFSKGHYHNVHCIHLPAGLGHTSANFDIGIDSCGTQGNTENGLYGYGQQSGSGSYFENIIVIQYDPQVQEVWDQARKLRCTWHDQYEKSVTFRPFPVDMLDVVRADFAGDNVGCWMQIQVGKGPWASEVSGLVKIGQSMTMVLAIKDDDNKFDMLVRNCMAHDGVRAPIQLVDQWGCVTRPKLMSRFTKIKNFGQSASVLSYAHFQAFKFPDSMEVHFQCTIQICRYQCPEQCTQPTDGASTGTGGYAGHIGKSGLPAEREEAAARRRRRSALNETNDDIIEFSTTFKAIVPGTSENGDQEDVGLNRVITVVSDGDLDFISGKGQGDGGSSEDGVPIVEATEALGDIVCMSTFGFASMLIVLIGTLLIACIVSAVIVLKRPRKY